MCGRRALEAAARVRPRSQPRHRSGCRRSKQRPAVSRARSSGTGPTDQRRCGTVEGCPGSVCNRVSRAAGRRRHTQTHPSLPSFPRSSCGWHSGACFVRTAAEKAAKDFPAISRLAGVKRQVPTSTARKIIAWCEDFAKGETSKIKNRQARAFYDDGVLTIQALAKTADAIPERFRCVARSHFTKALQAIRD
jgi:hypothetical protein